MIHEEWDISPLGLFSCLNVRWPMYLHFLSHTHTFSLEHIKREQNITLLPYFDALQRVPQTAEGVPKERQYLVYSDVIYLISRHLTSEFFVASLPQHRKNNNYGMATARESIEWSYGEIKQMSPFLQMKDNANVSHRRALHFPIIFHE